MPLITEPTIDNVQYLRTKQAKMGHQLGFSRDATARSIQRWPRLQGVIEIAGVPGSSSAREAANWLFAGAAIRDGAQLLDASHFLLPILVHSRSCSGEHIWPAPTLGKTARAVTCLDGTR